MPEIIIIYYCGKCDGQLSNNRYCGLCKKQYFVGDEK